MTSIVGHAVHDEIRHDPKTGRLTTLPGRLVSTMFQYYENRPVIRRQVRNLNDCDGYRGSVMQSMTYALSCRA